MRKGEKNEEDFIVTSCSLPILPPPPVHENRTLTSADEATTRFKGAQDITKVMMDPSCIEGCKVLLTFETVDGILMVLPLN